MAIKKIKKSKLRITDGYITDKKGRIVGGLDDVIRQANLLETKVQEQAYLCMQPKAQPMPSLDGFKRESSFAPITPEIHLKETPALDKMVETAMAIMDEVDRSHDAEEANRVFEHKVQDLYKFVVDDEVFIYTDAEDPERLDTPTLGNILELTEDDMVHLVMFTVNGELAELEFVDSGE